MPLRTYPEKLSRAGGTPKNVIIPAPHKNTMPTNNPMITNTAPTTLLLPDPKYAVNIPAIMLAMANTSVSMLIN